MAPNTDILSPAAEHLLSFACGRARVGSNGTGTLNMFIGGGNDLAAAIYELRSLGYCEQPLVGGRWPMTAKLTWLGYHIARSLGPGGTS